MRHVISIALTLAALAACSGSNEAGSRKVELENRLPLDVNLRNLGGGVNVPSSIADVTYHTEYTLDVAGTLRVWPRDGSAPVAISGDAIKATYYHLGRILEVEARRAGANEYHYFVEPVRWTAAK